MESLSAWFRRHFANPQVLLLTLLLLAGFGLILGLGQMLTPLLVALVLAYLLEGLVQALERRGLVRLLSVVLVFLLFLSLCAFILIVILPQLLQQLTDFVQQLPYMIQQGQRALEQLPQHYPELVTEERVRELIGAIRREVADLAQQVVTLSLASLVGLITLMVYLVLVPVLVFFLMKDKQRIVDWFANYLPHERGLALTVWRDVDRQIGNYVRGKVWEIFIVGAASYVTFTFMGLNYAVLLAVLVGLSVIIPYIGAAVATLPVFLVAYFQWGWTDETLWVMVAYGVLQALDGNVLVPLLFSEVVNLHPVAIIVAVLVFGGIWGFWGVFFAIPLATLVQAVLKAWPRDGTEPAEGLEHGDA